MLKSVIIKILHEVNNMKCGSVAIPALGTGNLGYPRDVAATIMLDAVIEFTKTQWDPIINDIRIVTYFKDTATVDVSSALCICFSLNILQSTITG